MIKMYCDSCGRVISRDQLTSWMITTEVKNKEFPKKSLKIKIVPTADNKCNDGEFCKYCVIDAINKLDDRPKVG